MSDIIGRNDTTLALTNKGVMALRDVDELLERARLMNSPIPVFREILDIRRSAQVMGVKVFMLLGRLEEQWKDFGVDDDFISTAEVETGLSVETIRKYTRLYRQTFGNPSLTDMDKNKLAGMSTKALLLAAPALAEGEVNVDEIVGAVTEGEVRDLVREKRGAKTSSENRVTILLDRTGQLKCRRGSDGPFEVFGFLNFEKAKTSPSIDAAISRLVGSAGIVEV